MGTSGNPAKRPANKKAAKPRATQPDVGPTTRALTSASGWRTDSPDEYAPVNLALPSGNVALVRRMRPEMLIDGGMIPDPLMPIVQKAIDTKRGVKPKAVLDSIATDTKQMFAMVKMMDNVVEYCVIEPKVSAPPVCENCEQYFEEGAHRKGKPGYHPYNEEPRDPDKLYVDNVSLDDKAFIFQWAAGGPEEYAGFRSESNGDVGAVQPGDRME